MILVELTINGTVFRISNDWINTLTHMWDGLIKSISPVQYATRTDAGGYVEPQYGTLILSPELFAGDWPPPMSCACTAKITDTTEEAAATIFTGTAHLVEIGDDEIRYEMHGPGYANELTSRTWIDGTLLEIFTTFCGASYLNLTLSHTYDRATSPAVYGVFESGTLIIEMLSQLAEAVNHLFYIKGGTLYLVDMLLSNGSDITRDEFQIFPVEYRESPAFKSFVSESIKKYTAAGTYAYGQVEQSAVSEGVEHLYLTVGDNSGNDQSWLIHDNVIEYRPSGYYKMIVKARRRAGSGSFYAGYLGMLADRVTICDYAGGTNYLNANWHCANNPAMTTAWSTHTGWTSGAAILSSTDAAPSLASPGTLHTNALYFRPVILLNYSAAAGLFDVDFVAIYRTNSLGDIQEELFFDDFSRGRDFRWRNFSGSGDPGIATSVAQSLGNMTTHLGNRKAILEAPRATVPMPLTAANLAEPGQKISWSDASISPDGADAVDAWIRVRSISFNVDKNRIIYEGEGAIA